MATPLKYFKDITGFASLKEFKKLTPHEKLKKIKLIVDTYNAIVNNVEDIRTLLENTFCSKGRIPLSEDEIKKQLIKFLMDRSLFSSDDKILVEFIKYLKNSCKQLISSEISNRTSKKGWNIKALEGCGFCLQLKEKLYEKKKDEDKFGFEENNHGEFGFGENSDEKIDPTNIVDEVQKVILQLVDNYDKQIDRIFKLLQAEKYWQYVKTNKFLSECKKKPSIQMDDSYLLKDEFNLKIHLFGQLENLKQFVQYLKRGCPDDDSSGLQEIFINCFEREAVPPPAQTVGNAGPGPGNEYIGNRSSRVSYASIGSTKSFEYNDFESEGNVSSGNLSNRLGSGELFGFGPEEESESAQLILRDALTKKYPSRTKKISEAIEVIKGRLKDKNPNDQEAIYKALTNYVETEKKEPDKVLGKNDYTLVITPLIQIIDSLKTTPPYDPPPGFNKSRNSEVKVPFSPMKAQLEGSLTGRKQSGGARKLSKKQRTQKRRNHKRSTQTSNRKLLQTRTLKRSTQKRSRKQTSNRKILQSRSKKLYKTSNRKLLQKRSTQKRSRKATRKNRK